jgi:hypothetical protein
VHPCAISANTNISNYLILIQPSQIRSMKWRNCQAMVGLQLSRGSPWTSELYDDNFVWCKLAWSDPCLNVKFEVLLKLSVAGHSGSDSARWFTFFKQGVRIRSTLK